MQMRLQEILNTTQFFSLYNINIIMLIFNLKRLIPIDIPIVKSSSCLYGINQTFNAKIHIMTAWCELISDKTPIKARLKILSSYKTNWIAIICIFIVAVVHTKVSITCSAISSKAIPRRVFPSIRQLISHFIMDVLGIPFEFWI